MGLDQYANTVTPRGQTLREQMMKLKTNEERRLFKEESRLSDEVEEIQYWRKHADLNEWMTQLAVKRGVVQTAREFNCVDLVLTPDDIDELEKAVNGDGLPHGAGFFWGASSEKDKEDDLKFIENARQAFKDGLQVIYSCWW